MRIEDGGGAGYRPPTGGSKSPSRQTFPPGSAWNSDGASAPRSAGSSLSVRPKPEPTPTTPTQLQPLPSRPWPRVRLQSTVQRTVQRVASAVTNVATWSSAAVRPSQHPQQASGRASERNHRNWQPASNSCPGSSARHPGNFTTVSQCGPRQQISAATQSPPSARPRRTDPDQEAAAIAVAQTSRFHAHSRRPSHLAVQRAAITIAAACTTRCTAT
jgi:hypothetical protein